MAEFRSTDSDADGIKELRRQLVELRAENDRLRGLLGVGTRDEAVSPWEPTLFVEDEGDADGAAVTAVDAQARRQLGATGLCGNRSRNRQTPVGQCHDEGYPPRRP